jgi:hypothetical protein
MESHVALHKLARVIRVFWKNILIGLGNLPYTRTWVRFAKSGYNNPIITMKKLNKMNRHVSLALSIVCIGAMPLTVGLLATGCAGDRYHESTGEGIDDTATTARVKKALHADTQYKYDDVKVTTFKGTVQLSGFANSRDAKNRAGEIAQTVEGVKDLKNNITVKE